MASLGRIKKAIQAADAKQVRAEDALLKQRPATRIKFKNNSMTAQHSDSRALATAASNPPGGAP